MQVYQVRSLDRPLFIVFVQNSEGIIVTLPTREQGMMECAVSSSLFSVYAIKKRVHWVSTPRKVARDGISVAKGLIGDQLRGKPASQASELMTFFFTFCGT